MIWFYYIIPMIMAIGGLLIFGNSKSVHGKHLAVLGMKGAGKTRLYCFMRNIKYKEEATGKNEYPSFDYTKSDGTKVRIEKGYDIGGGEDFIRDNYEKMMKDSDIVIFVFDISKYFSDTEEYQRQTNSRFDFINKKISENENKVIIGSHLDQLKSEKRETIKDRFLKNIKDKPYSGMFTVNFFLADITNNEQIKGIIDKIL